MELLTNWNGAESEDVSFSSLLLEGVVLRRGGVKEVYKSGQAAQSMLEM